MRCLLSQLSQVKPFSRCRQTSEIEGECFETEQVRSSIGRRLGMEVVGLAKPDQRVEGVVEMSLDAATNFEESLSLDRLRSDWRDPRVYQDLFALLTPITPEALNPLWVVSRERRREPPLQ